MLPNGNVTRGKGQVLVENTTAFDTFAYIIACLASDHPLFKTTLMETVWSDMKSFLESYFANGADSRTLRCRYSILSSIFSQQIIDKMKVLNCKSTVVEIVKQMWESVLQCGCKLLLELNLNEKTIFEYSDICESESQLKNLIFVDLKDQKMQHNTIPQVLLINNGIFALCAIVNKIDYSNGNSHFVLNIKRSNSQWYRFDNKVASISVSKFSRKLETIHMLCYLRVRNVADDPEKGPQNTRIELNSEIIQNFHTFNFYGTNVEVNNACGPDSIFHGLAHIFAESSDIFDTVNPNDPLLELINAYSKKTHQKSINLESNCCSKPDLNLCSQPQMMFFVMHFVISNRVKTCFVFQILRVDVSPSLANVVKSTIIWQLSKSTIPS